jgi:DNA-binding transcriptional LysR family regulator
MKNADQVSLRQLRCFVAVAEELHFRRAADRLAMRQPPLTQRIQDMERDLGVELFRRIGMRVELTDAGRTLLTSARETLKHAENFYDAAQRAARGTYGQIKVGLTITALFFDAVRQTMREFQRQHPDVSLDLTLIHSVPALDALRQRELDMCLMRVFPAPVPADCEQIVIARDRLMLALPAEHPLCELPRVSLNATADESFVALSCKAGTAIERQIASLWQRAGLTPRITQEADHGPAVLALVAGGFGNAILPGALQAIRFDHVVWKIIDIDERLTESSVHLVYHKHALREPAVATLIDCLRRRACEPTNLVRQFG